MRMYISVAAMLPTDMYVVRLFRMVSIPIIIYIIYFIMGIFYSMELVLYYFIHMNIV